MTSALLNEEAACGLDAATGAAPAAGDACLRTGGRAPARSGLRRRLGGALLACAAALAGGGLAGPLLGSALAADVSASGGSGASGAGGASATEAPQEIIQRLAEEILQRIKSDPQLHSGDPQKLSALVDKVLMPHVNFQRMTALAAGRWWREATPEQKKQLMHEFREMLLRTYSGAVSSVNNQSVRLRPMRADPDATDVIVRTEIVQPGAEPVRVDYRMQKTPDGWKIYDVNVMGIWLVETYRTQFNQEASRTGVEGLIRSLAEKNRESGPDKRS